MKQFIVLVLSFVLLSLLGCAEDSAINNNPTHKISITRQPMDALVYDGQIASFGVSAKGTDPSFQWFKDDEPYAEGAQVTVEAKKANDGATFYCNISNSTGSVKSDVAQLEVVEAPESELNGGMCKIPAVEYSFVMGSVSSKAASNESPLHTVSFSNSFWMDTVPVDQQSYELLMKNANPTTHSKMPWQSSSELLPADSISWNDAVLFCNARSESEGLDSVYYYETIVVVENSDTNQTILHLNDSLLVRNVKGITTTSTCIVEDSVAIILADTTKDTSTSVERLVDTVLQDTTKFNVWYWRVASPETVLVVPNESYNLLNTMMFTSNNFISDPDTLHGEREEVVRTIVKSPSDTIYVRIINDTDDITERIFDFYDTLIIAGGEIVDTSIEFLEGQYDTISNGDTTSTDVKGYRLPTEAEWEFAARGGSGSDYFWGDEIGIDTNAWCISKTDSLEKSGQCESNVYGARDMSGNVWEWCYDYYAAYGSEGEEDPSGPSSGESRVIRGGSWSDMPIYLRSSQRGSSSPARVTKGVGFRTVLNE